MGSDVRKTNRVVRDYDWGEVQPAVAIIELIAELEEEAGVDVASVLEPPLQMDIDTDAFNTLVRNENMITISPRVSRYQIQIHENTVEISTIAEN